MEQGDKYQSWVNLTIQMRNVNTAVQADWFVSPVADDSGMHFVSSPDSPQWPVDTDANAAYNIARKGLLMVQAIAVTPETEKLDMAVTNERWFTFIQNEQEKEW